MRWQPKLQLPQPQHQGGHLLPKLHQSRRNEFCPKGVVWPSTKQKKMPHVKSRRKTKREEQMTSTKNSSGKIPCRSHNHNSRTRMLWPSCEKPLDMPRRNEVSSTDRLALPCRKSQMEWTDSKNQSANMIRSCWWISSDSHVIRTTPPQWITSGILSRKEQQPRKHKKGIWKKQQKKRKKLWPGKQKQKGDVAELIG